MSSKSTISAFHAEPAFDGRTLLRASFGLFLIAYVAHQAQGDSASRRDDCFFSVYGALYVCALCCYFLGFWKAVAGKGYPRLFFLVSLVPVGGYVLIMLIPFSKNSASATSSDQ